MSEFDYGDSKRCQNSAHFLENNRIPNLGQWLQWGGVERGGGVKVIYLLPTTRDTRDYLPK